MDQDDARRIEVSWEDPINHPQCPHGPTLLFITYFKGGVKKYYKCSTCDKNSCTFCLRYGQEMSKSQKHEWKLESKKLAQHYDHQQLYIRFNKLETEPVAKRRYCHSCEKLILNFEKDQHKDHKITENLTDYQMHHPTELLIPLENARKEAQYFFSKKTTEDIVNMLLNLEAKQILCIGTPRIHEYIIESHKDKMSSLLLDIDGRFHNFFGPMDYCWYNLYNHHFFNNDAVSVFKDFLTQNEGKDTYLICDPPFGGRLEPISYTIKTISDLHKKLNKQISNDDFFLKIMFIYPSHMKGVLRMKWNPRITGGLKDLKMSDYKVDYDNHPTYISKESGTEQGSLARIFTNIPLVSQKLLYCNEFVVGNQKWGTEEEEEPVVAQPTSAGRESNQGRKKKKKKNIHRLDRLGFPSFGRYKLCQKCNTRFSTGTEYGIKCKECISKRWSNLQALQLM